MFNGRNNDSTEPSNIWVFPETGPYGVRLVVFGTGGVAPVPFWEVIFVEKSASTTPEKELIERSAAFYGLKVRTFFFEESGKSAEILKALKHRRARAAVITAQVLALLTPESEKEQSRLGERIPAGNASGTLCAALEQLLYKEGSEPGA